MKILQITPAIGNKHNHIHASQAEREYVALKATALDATRYPILAEHWPGLLLVGGKLAVNENCTRQFNLQKTGGTNV